MRPSGPKTRTRVGRRMRLDHVGAQHGQDSDRVLVDQSIRNEENTRFSRSLVRLGDM